MARVIPSHVVVMLPCVGFLLAQNGCPEDDLDHDGYSQEEGDCDDTNPDIYPGQLESCDGVDNDCDGMVDNIHAWHVDAAAGAEGDGLTWETAFDTLDDATEAARMCAGPIWVATGTYRAALPSSPVLDMPFGITVYGGFEGSETALEQRAGLFDETILSGDYDASGDLSEPDSPRVVIGASGARLDGFRIEGGYARDDGVQVQTTGAGMYNLLVTDLIVAHVTFKGNHADFSAGAVWNEESDVLFESVRFEENSADEYGGAVLNYRSRSSFSESSWIANSARLGGALYHEGEDMLTISSSSFVDNQATDGGAILSNGDLSLGNVDFLSNRGNMSYGEGGAVYLSPGAVAEFVNVSALDNAAWSGDVLFLDGSAGHVSNTVVWTDTQTSGLPFVAYTDDASLEVSYSAASVELSGEANLVLDSNPFVVIDVDGDGQEELLLDESSACRDAGSNADADGAAGLDSGWWRDSATTVDCLVDADPVDLGRHYEDCRL